MIFNTSERHFKYKHFKYKASFEALYFFFYIEKEIYLRKFSAFYWNFLSHRNIYKVKLGLRVNSTLNKSKTNFEQRINHIEIN